MLELVVCRVLCAKVVGAISSEGFLVYLCLQLFQYTLQNVLFACLLIYLLTFLLTCRVSVKENSNKVEFSLASTGNDCRLCR